MLDSTELVLCYQTERVSIFKLPLRSPSNGFYLNDWKQMFWEGGVKVTQKDKVITITFIGKDDKIFASSKIPANYNQGIVKTVDSSRGYAVRLENPKGGFLWVGVAFRDRSDAFDFEAVLQNYAKRKKMLFIVQFSDENENCLQSQFGKDVVLSYKKDEEIKLNIEKKKEQDFINEQNNFNFSFFNDFNIKENATSKTNKQTNNANQDQFSDFDKNQQKKAENKKANDLNLLDF